MAHDPTLFWPTGKGIDEGQEVQIPGSAVLLKIDGETLPVTGAANLFKSPGGVWVPVSQDNRLPVEATLTGSNVADDSPLPLSAVEDDEGKGVLRVYNAGPHAYDVGNDVWRVTNPNPQAYSEEDDLFRVASAGPMEDFAVLEDEVVPAGASLMLVPRQTVFPENKSRLIVAITTAPGSHTQWRVSIAGTASNFSTSDPLKRFRSIYNADDMRDTLPNQDSFAFVTPVWTASFPRFEISLANLSDQDDLDVRLAWVGVGR